MALGPKAHRRLLQLLPHLRTGGIIIDVRHPPPDPLPDLERYANDSSDDNLLAAVAQKRRPFHRCGNGVDFAAEDLGLAKPCLDGGRVRCALLVLAEPAEWGRSNRLEAPGVDSNRLLRGLLAQLDGAPRTIELSAPMLANAMLASGLSKPFLAELPRAAVDPALADAVRRRALHAWAVLLKQTHRAATWDDVAAMVDALELSASTRAWWAEVEKKERRGY